MANTQRWKRPGAGKLLALEEEEGIILWLDRSLVMRLRVTKQTIVNECNYIHPRRVHDESIHNLRTCGEHWALQSLKAHPQHVRVDNQKVLASEAAEDRVALMI